LCLWDRCWLPDALSAATPPTTPTTATATTTPTKTPATGNGSLNATTATSTTTGWAVSAGTNIGNGETTTMRACARTRDSREFGPPQAMIMTAIGSRPTAAPRPK